MRFALRIPGVASSAVAAGPRPLAPVLDGRDVVVGNHWHIPPHTVALVGRPAVWFSLDLTIPAIAVGPFEIAARHVVWEQDFGGHLFLAITGADDSRVTIVEAGPANPNGTGALVPFAYPEESFAERGVVDFDPIPIAPPHGMTEEYFAQLVRTTQRAYDGDQRYLAVEIPFLRVGRDSNSYAMGVLLCCGVDPRSIPKPLKALRFEWTGYPGTNDPVHLANFGAYVGAPSPLDGGCIDIAYHSDDGGVRYVLVGGEPEGRARLPDGSAVDLDARGRIAFAPDQARQYGLPTTTTEPPAQVRARRHFPSDPAPAGAEITLILDGHCVALQPGTRFRGTVVRRHDGLGLAWLHTAAGTVVLPLAELGVELRDPKRVDRLLRIGSEVTLGLTHDRHPRLSAHGPQWLGDWIGGRRLHLPRPLNAGVATAVLAAMLFGGIAWSVRRRS